MSQKFLEIEGVWNLRNKLPFPIRLRGPLSQVQHLLIQAEDMAMDWPGEMQLALSLPEDFSLKIFSPGFQEELKAFNRLIVAPRSDAPVIAIVVRPGKKKDSLLVDFGYCPEYVSATNVNGVLTWNSTVRRYRSVRSAHVHESLNMLNDLVYDEEFVRHLERLIAQDHFYENNIDTISAIAIAQDLTNVSPLGPDDFDLDVLEPNQF